MYQKYGGKENFAKVLSMAIEDMGTSIPEESRLPNHGYAVRNVVRLISEFMDASTNDVSRKSLFRALTGRNQEEKETLNQKFNSLTIGLVNAARPIYQNVKDSVKPTDRSQRLRDSIMLYEDVAASLD